MKPESLGRRRLRRQGFGHSLLLQRHRLAIEYRFGQIGKRFVDVAPRLGARLEKSTSIPGGKFLGALALHDARQIALVPDDHAHGIVAARALIRDVFHPLGDVVERFLVRHVVGENDSHRSAIECVRYRPKAFVTGRVPYLEFDLTLSQSNRLRFEVDADRAEHVLREMIIDVA